MVLRALLEGWLVLLFGSTSVGELAHRRNLVAALVSHGWPWRAARLLARAIPVSGLTLAALLVLRPQSRLAALVAVALLAVYLGYKVVLLHRRPGTSCGCGGTARTLDQTAVWAGGVHLGLAALYALLVLQ